MEFGWVMGGAMHRRLRQAAHLVVRERDRTSVVEGGTRWDVRQIVVVEQHRFSGSQLKPYSRVVVGGG